MPSSRAGRSVFPFSMPSNSDNFKAEWVNVPISIRKDWLAEIQSKGRKLGMSRNAAFLFAVKLGAPLLQAHIELMEKTLLESCRKIADGKFFISEILGTPPLPMEPATVGTNERRKRKSARKNA